MAAISFTDEDLAANKLGRLTERQKQKMEREFENFVVTGKKIVFWLWVAVFVSFFSMVVVGLPEQLFSRGTKPAMPGDSLKWALIALFAISVIASTVSSICVFVAHNGRRNSKLDLPVYCARGIMEKTSFEDFYTLAIGGREFVFSDTDDTVYSVFETGGQYSVYYVFNTAHIIVSAELG